MADTIFNYFFLNACLIHGNKASEETPTCTIIHPQVLDQKCIFSKNTAALQTICHRVNEITSHYKWNHLL